ncbi:MAG TPA: DUF1361 domain-containing protein [Candidatus Saccharimonadales bacterium]|nr:DUF1361 domain-containing protein [Candidatus Saccharimonadales bacterium]
MGTAQRVWPELGRTLLFSSLVSIGLYAGGVLQNNNYSYSYMLWNLFLAWIPLVLTVALLRMLRRKRWSSWQGIGLSLAWLLFLPNSFYMVSDLIHLQDELRVDVLYDSVMLTSFVLNGLLLGYISLYLFHLELKKRLPRKTARNMVGFVLLLCSFAIYLGRELRWNSWDVLVNPAGILFDVSDRFLKPMAYPDMFVTTGIFFLLLAMTYYVLWKVVAVLRRVGPGPGADA